MGISTQSFEAHDWKVGRPYLSVGSWQRERTERHSIYRHPLGLAEVAEYRGHRNPITSITFSWDGYSYHRRWEAAWGEKTLARLARQMIEEITA